MTPTPTSGAADLRATFSEMLVDLPNTEPFTLFKAGFDAALAAGQATAAQPAPATQQEGAEPPGIQALMCVISSLRDMAHFSDGEGGELMSALCALRDWAHAQPAPATQQAGERVYAFRRKGLADFCTCDEARYEELSNKPRLFETRIFYTAPQLVARVPLDEARRLFDAGWKASPTSRSVGSSAARVLAQRRGLSGRR